ncbi:hypothetical protein IKZ40_09355 [bacterium]|nr:hypothetical protein [bacterium]
MKTLFPLLVFSLLLGAASLEAREIAEPTNALPAVAEKRIEAPNKEDNPVQKELNARDDRRADRESAKADRDTQGIETYTDTVGWETADGYAVMQDYVARLKKVFETRLTGLIEKVAGGKKGILLVVTDKAKRNFFLAQENTSQLLNAIVDDLDTMPEPILLQVTVNYRNVPIIVAFRENGENKVEYLK